MSQTRLGLIGTVLWACIILLVFPYFQWNMLLKVTVGTINNVMWYHVILFGLVWHVEIQLDLIPPLWKSLPLPTVLQSSLCLTRGTLSEILRGELVWGSLLWVESRKRWIQTKKTTLVDVLPSFLHVTRPPLFAKFNLENWTLLCRPPISSMLFLSILSTQKQSEGHWRRFHSATKKKVPMLKKIHHQKHLEFAKRHENWTVEDWKKVLWSDETKINRIGSDGKLYVWKQRGESISDHTTTPCYVPYHKVNSVSVSVRSVTLLQAYSWFTTSSHVRSLCKLGQILCHSRSSVIIPNMIT